LLTPSEEIQEGAISAEKIMASIFWDNNDWLSGQGRTINGYYYADELRRMLQELARRRRSKLTQGVLLLHDNAPSCDGCCIWLRLWNSSTSPIISGLATFEFLFPKLKTKLHGRALRSNEGVMEAVNEFFEDQNREFKFIRVNKLEHRLAKCNDVESDFIESQTISCVLWLPEVHRAAKNLLINPRN
jgi:hypothetical protein